MVGSVLVGIVLFVLLCVGEVVFVLLETRARAEAGGLCVSGYFGFSLLGSFLVLQHIWDMKPNPRAALDAAAMPQLHAKRQRLGPSERGR
jgi:hypothetical protein